MSKTIWKYPIATTDLQVVQMPAGAEVLCVQVQRGEPCLWALVDPSAEPEFRSVEVYGTGHTVRIDTGVERRYVGTYQLYGGDLIFHVFVS